MVRVPDSLGVLGHVDVAEDHVLETRPLNILIASSGEQTMGSPRRLSDVLITQGRPVRRLKAWMSSKNRGLARFVTIWGRAVPSTWLTWLKPGAEFQFQVDETDKSYVGVVRRLGAAVDTVSQTIKVFAKFAAPTPDILPGMSGTAQFKYQEG